MAQESRVRKSLKNARVNLVFYFVFIVLSFFSRKIFLECLGSEFLGLSGTLGNILGFLSLAEMGVGTAVAYTLYKPLNDNNHDEIENIVSVFGYLYRKIGIIVLLGAIIVSLFIPLIFKSEDFSYGVIYYVFFSIVLSSLLGYFINYRQILLTADQKGYVVTAYLQTASVCKILIQMVSVYYWSNYYLWTTIEILFGILACIILNLKIDKEYPWLNVSVKRGKLEYSNYKEITKKTKQIFVHKIAAFVLNQSDQILIFAFVSLKMVAYYGNYTLIATRISQLFATALDSMGAGVGNLIAEGNKEKIKNVFWELISVRYWVAGVLCFGLYTCIEPFITVWLGEQYILSHAVLILLLVNIFITQTRGVVDMFISGYGLFSDTWAPIVEASINIVITVITASYYGISGILLGKIVSMMIIVVIWKPFFLFHNGIVSPVSTYWKIIFAHLLCLAISFALTLIFANVIHQYITPSESLLTIIVYAISVTLPFVIIYSALMYILTPGFKFLIRRFLNIIQK